MSAKQQTKAVSHLRIIKCDRSMCRVLVPYSTLVAVPRSQVFELATRFPAVKKLGWGFVVEIPRGSVVRVKDAGARKAKYYLVDGELVELKGTRAKIIGYNMWGWHYIDPRTERRVVTVIYREGVFIALWEKH